MITNIYQPVLRAPDKFGSGEFGAPRGNRTHVGTDFAIQVVSPVAGEITKLGYPYADDLSFRYVEITDENNYRVRLFYVSPLVNVGDIVLVGDAIGMLQTLQGRYEGITDHVHLEVKKPDNSYISWDEYNEL